MGSARGDKTELGIGPGNLNALAHVSSQFSELAKTKALALECHQLVIPLRNPRCDSIHSLATNLMLFCIAFIWILVVPFSQARFSQARFPRACREKT